MTHLLHLDEYALVLLGMVLIPWLPDFIESFKLPGGTEFQLREQVETLQSQQSVVQAAVSQQAEDIRAQEKEIRGLRFLISYFVTEPERKHLEALSAEERPFLVRADATTTYFDTEIRRLRHLGFLETLPGTGVTGLMETIRNASGKAVNVKQHLQLTARGAEYLSLVREFDTPSTPDEHSPGAQR